MSVHFFFEISTLSFILLHVFFSFSPLLPPIEKSPAMKTKYLKYKKSRYKAIRLVSQHHPNHQSPTHPVPNVVGSARMGKINAKSFHFFLPPRNMRKVLSKGGTPGQEDVKYSKWLPQARFPDLLVLISWRL